MTSRFATQYRPTTVSPPGETLADLLEERGSTQAELATRMDRPLKTINQIVKGKTAITPETALQLERALGTPAEFWLSREAKYRSFLARRQDSEERSAELSWLKELPLKEMIRHGWIRQMDTKLDQLIACLEFFGVASVQAWRSQYAEPLVAFRKSSKFETQVGAVAAWLRQGEHEAKAGPCRPDRPFDKVAFRRLLPELRRLTLEPPEVFQPQLLQTCARVGVAVVFLPTPKGCPASGVTRFLGDVAVLQLSLRYKTNDHLWFTFFHEAGHLVLHGKRLTFIEQSGREKVSVDERSEVEADVFARDLLIPPEAARRLPLLGHSATAVADFSQRLGIAPGIVVGRMQKEGLIGWPEFNHLKVKYQWSDEGEEHLQN